MGAMSPKTKARVRGGTKPWVSAGGGGTGLPSFPGNAQHAALGHATATARQGALEIAAKDKVMEEESETM